MIECFLRDRVDTRSMIGLVSERTRLSISEACVESGIAARAARNGHEVGNCQPFGLELPDVLDVIARGEPDDGPSGE